MCRQALMFLQDVVSPEIDPGHARYALTRHDAQRRRNLQGVLNEACDGA